MNYEIDKTTNDLKNMYIIFSPKKLDNIKIVNDDNDKLIIEDTNINELYKKLITSNIINE